MKMNKKYKLLPIIFSILTIFSSCALKESGKSLSAFVERLNTINESYNITESGFIINEEKCTLTKFFDFADNSIMLQFTYSDKNELTSLNIVFDNITENNSEELTFIKNVISAFINDEKTYGDLLTEISFDTCLYTVNNNTQKAKIGNVEMLIDVTEIGTVITVFQNIL